MKEKFSPGVNYAVIAPNMAKQIVALQLGLKEMADRFPQSFSGYALTVTESHQVRDPLSFMMLCYSVLEKYIDVL